jgi:HlyD family secretion protein
VTEIANSARITGQGSQEQVTNFPVKVRILDEHNLADGGAIALTAEEATPVRPVPSFRPGMSGRVDIYTHTVFNAVTIPIQAVTVRDFQRVRATGDTTVQVGRETGSREDLRRVVFIVDEGRARMVEVETGISDDTNIEIRSGLGGSENVITGPFRVVSRDLQPDALVRTATASRNGGVSASQN